jgi:predicted transcriptional regulator
MERAMKAKNPKAAAERLDEYEAWYKEQARLGLEDLDAGRVVSDEEARAHMQRLPERLLAADQAPRAA